jgi:hypothetical protein
MANQDDRPARGIAFRGDCYYVVRQREFAGFCSSRVTMPGERYQRNGRACRFELRGDLAPRGFVCK